MKKLILIVGILFAGVISYAAEAVYRSSTTATADTLGILCGGSRGRGFVYSVAVSSSSGTAGLLSVFNSSFTATANTVQIGPIDTRTITQYEYRAGFPAGLSYTKTGTAVATIIYDCY